MARLLASRAVNDVDGLSVSLANLLPPNTLTHNETTATLLADAIDAKKKILVVGDYLRA